MTESESCDCSQGQDVLDVLGVVAQHSNHRLLLAAHSQALPFITRGSRSPHLVESRARDSQSISPWPQLECRLGVEPENEPVLRVVNLGSSSAHPCR